LYFLLRLNHRDRLQGRQPKPGGNMKHSHGKQITTILPLSIMALVAAVGWYFYYSEVNKNQSLTIDSQSEQGILNNQLAKQQATIVKLQAGMVAEQQSRQEQAGMLEKTTAEKITAQSELQGEIQRAKLTTAELETELENRQTTINTLREDVTALQAGLVAEQQSRQQLADMLEKTTAEKFATQSDLQGEIKKAKLTTAELETELENRQTTINTLREDVTALQAGLASEQQSRQGLADMLEKTTAQKFAVESNLKGEINSAALTTAELEAELEKRQAMQKSLHDEISTISGEKSQLLMQLEHEQESKQRISNLKSRIEQELNESRVEILQLKNQMTVIKLTSEVLFSSGSARIKPAGQKVLSIIAESLNAYPDRAVSVEGHTDNLPIRNARYDSNWELSAARGLAAVNYFQRNAQVDPGRLKVVGYGQYHPVSSNETAAGRKRNRRIEIRILPPESVNVTQN
jgi:chemotaxis protein MotB